MGIIIIIIKILALPANGARQTRGQQDAGPDVSRHGGGEALVDLVEDPRGCQTLTQKRSGGAEATGCEGALDKTSTVLERRQCLERDGGGS